MNSAPRPPEVVLISLHASGGEVELRDKEPLRFALKPGLNPPPSPASKPFRHRTDYETMLVRCDAKMRNGLGSRRTKGALAYQFSAHLSVVQAAIALNHAYHPKCKLSLERQSGGWRIVYIQLKQTHLRR